MTDRPKLRLISGAAPAAEAKRLADASRIMADHALVGFIESLADARIEAEALDGLDLPPGIKDRIRRWAIESKAVAESIQVLRLRR